MEKSSGTLNEYQNKPLELEPSSQFRFAEDKSKGIIVNTALTKIRPTQGANFTPGQKIVLEIPSTAWFDPAKFFISFRLVVKLGNGNPYGGWAPGTAVGSWNYIRMKSSCHSIFERVTMLFGSSQPLEDLVDYDLVAKVLAISTLTEEYVNKHGFLFEGLHNERDYFKQVMANFNAKSSVRDDDSIAGQGHQYIMQPCLGLFRCGKFLPTAYTGMLTIWLYLNKPERVLLRSVKSQGLVDHDPADLQFCRTHTLTAANPIDETNADHVFEPNATYEIQNVQAFVTTIYPMAEYNNAMNTKLSSGSPVKIWLDFFRVHSRQIAGFNQGAYDILIAERAADLKGILCVMVNAGDRESKVQELSFHHNYLSRYRLRIGDQYFPSQDVECAAHGGLEAYQQLQEVLGVSNDITGTNLIDTDLGYRPRNAYLTDNNFVLRKFAPFQGPVHSNQFILGHNFETSPGQLSGEDTLRQNSDIAFHLIFNKAGSPDAIGGDLARRYLAATPEDADGVCILPFFTARPQLNNSAGAIAATHDPRFLTSAGVYANGAWTAEGAGDNFVAAQIAPAGYYPFGSGTKIFAALGYLHALSTLPSMKTGYCSPVPILQSAVGGANWNKIAANGVVSLSTIVSGANTVVNKVSAPFLFDLTAYRALPTYFEFFCIAHITAKMIIETFGTVTVTTDIYNS